MLRAPIVFAKRMEKHKPGATLITVKPRLPPLVAPPFLHPETVAASAHSLPAAESAPGLRIITYPWSTM